MLFASDTLDEAPKVLDTSNILKAAGKSGHDRDPVKVLYELLVAPDRAMREKYCMAHDKENRVYCLWPFHDYCESIRMVEMKIERERGEFRFLFSHLKHWQVGLAFSNA
jgi:hypothetical protein